ncbi:MAG: FG-GAP-like repeat-containing protein, partial [Verrucomicrobiales bacterium]
SWAVKICDLDNDGLNDVFVTNGMEQNLRELEGTTGGAERKDLLKENNLAFRNQGDLKFVETGQDWGIGHFGYSTAAASSDFDRDGDLDLLVVNRDEPPTLYKNQSNADGVLVRLHGRSSNRDGIGAVIKIETGSGRQVREIFCSRGYLGSDEAMAHFGLGADDSIKELTVAWPSGHRQTFTDLAGSSLYEITEPDGPPATGSPAPEPAGASPMFAPNRDLPDLVHVERDYDDFAAQPLLPNKLSQLGPGIAVGDIDQDGDEDFILGGASGSQTQVVTSLGDGKYARPRPIPGTERFEDMGLVLLDCDGDGDRDLYVASGGVEGSSADLQDRLYLNDGSGSFSEAPADSLPAHRDSGGPVATADVDRDGDLDLFVGGRLIPGQYPLAAESRLLINQGGTFTTADFPSELGLVTGATFSDIDGDGWQDLLVAREWGPIAYLQNEEGQFSDRTEAAGLAGVSGWWNGIATGDVDNDGDIDLVASNFGLNTKYHASAGHPAQLFYGSFGTDKMRLVEAEFEGGELLPVRGKSCSTQAIPHLGEKFKTFHDFALADVREIYTQPALDDSTRFAATTLKSGVFLNDGEGQFEFSALPRLAQIAPGFGIVISELDGDGNPDLFLAQNFFQPQAETGRMSGGLSLVLTGTGSGRFEPVWPKDSGVIVPDDTTAAAVTDTNGDGWPDLLLASNNGPVHNLINRGSSESTEGRITRIVLRGQPGNPDGIGARVIAETGESRRQMAEVQSGSGYLSQSAPGVFFGGEIDKVTVRWPDGKSTVETVDSDKHTLVIDQP